MASALRCASFKKLSHFVKSSFIEIISVICFFTVVYSIVNGDSSLSKVWKKIMNEEHVIGNVINFIVNGGWIPVLLCGSFFKQQRTFFFMVMLMFIQLTSSAVTILMFYPFLRGFLPSVICLPVAIILIALLQGNVAIFTSNIVNDKYYKPAAKEKPVDVLKCYIRLLGKDNKQIHLTDEPLKEEEKEKESSGIANSQFLEKSTHVTLCLNVANQNMVPIIKDCLENGTSIGALSDEDTPAPPPYEKTPGGPSDDYDGVFIRDAADDRQAPPPYPVHESQQYVGGV